MRGIVRASGAAACQVLWNAMDPDCPGSMAVRARVRGVHVVRLRDPAIPALAMVMPGPTSATGEDCAEIHTAGNPFVLERIMTAVIAHSDGTARRAHPGEFSVRAVLSGRMPIASAERVAAVIMAETDAQLAAASMLHVSYLLAHPTLVRVRSSMRCCSTRAWSKVHTAEQRVMPLSTHVCYPVVLK